MNKKSIIRLLIILWIVGCAFSIPYVCFLKKTTKYNNIYFEQLKEIAVVYINQEIPQPSLNAWEVYTLNTSDVNKKILFNNFFSTEEEYIYPYGKTNIYLTNGDTTVVVIFEKTTDEKVIISGYQFIEE